MTTTSPPHTAVPAVPDPTGAVEVRRVTSGRGPVDVMVVIGAAVAALSLTALLVTRVIPVANMIGFGAIAYLLFLALCSRCSRCYSSSASRSGEGARRYRT